MDRELQHHGILGQKWGVRRTPAQLGRRSGGLFKKKEVNEEYKNAHASKKVKQMSNAELKTRIERINLERQYSQLKPSRIARGKEILTTAAVITGSVIALKKNRDTIVGWFG